MTIEPQQLASPLDSEQLVALAPVLLATADEQGRYLYLNGAWEELLGWEPQELIGRNGAELMHPDDLARAESELSERASERHADEIELRVLAKDGSWRWIDWRVRHEGGRWYAAGQESGRRRADRESYAAGEARLTEAQRVAGIGSFEFDLDGGTLLWSDEHFRVFGLEPGAIDATPDSSLEFTHPADRQRVRAYWDQLMHDPASSGSIQFRIQRADGAERILSLRGSLVERDGARRIVGTIQDVTERRRAQQALEASERRYRVLVEQVPAVVYTAALGAEGAWEFVSPHVERMLGYPAHEWTQNANHWFATVHPDDRGRVMADEAQLRGPGDKLLSEYRMVASDGSVVHVRDEATVIQAEHGDLLLQGVIVDVTKRREAEEALAESEERYRRVVDTSRDIIFSIDADMRLGFVNDAVRETLGCEPEELIGRPFTERQAPAMAERALELAGKVLSGVPVHAAEVQVLRKDGGTAELSVSAVAQTDAEGNAIGLTGTARDITEAKRHADALREKHEQLQSIIDNSPLTIYAKDRDMRYALINRDFEDSMNLAPGELIGKGDEYVFPPPVAEKLRATDRQVLESGAPLEVEEVVPISGSDRTFLVHKFPLRGVGGEVYGLCGIATDITERKAREDALTAKVEWSFRIRQAIATNRLVLHSQPIIDVATGQKVQEELLLRMRGENSDELVMPSEFLLPAERFGLAPAIDRWVVERAVRLARHQRVEVNLSGQSIGDPALTKYIHDQLEETGADPANLVFEITETTAAQDLSQARSLAHRLVQLGCGFALDDFGIGYGSFTYLKHLPVSYIKIDMEFVRNLHADPSDRQVVSAIVDVARNFGIKTIAEGVESPEALALLGGLGVDLAQGYHIGRPVAVDGLDAV